MSRHEGSRAGLVPFQISELARAVNPIRLPEYLAAVLLGVSKPLLETVACSVPVRTGEGRNRFHPGDWGGTGGRRDRAVRSAAMACETWPKRTAMIAEHLDLAAARTDRPADTQQ